MMKSPETVVRSLQEERSGRTASFLQTADSRRQTNFQPLDIAACYGTGLTAQTIRYGTAALLAPPRLRIGPSHVAVLCEFRGSMVWVESTTLCKHPCAILGYQVDGCQAHLPEDRIRDYITTGGHVDLYRLSPIEKLSQSESELLTTILVRHFIGQRVTYDLGGALVSGTRLFKRTRLLPSADLNELFCSELVAAVCMRLGRMNRANPSRFNPACLLRELVRQGTFQFVRTFGPQASGDRLQASGKARHV